MGNPGKFLSLSEDGEFLTLREEFFNKIPLLIQKKRTAIYPLCEFFEKNKDEKDALFEFLTLFFGDILLKKNFLEGRIINRDKTEILDRFNAETTKKSVVTSLEIIARLQRELGKYGAYALCVNDMFIKLWEEING